MELLDGKKTSTLVQETIAEEVHKIVAQGQRLSSHTRRR